MSYETVKRPPAPSCRSFACPSFAWKKYPFCRTQWLGERILPEICIVTLDFERDTAGLEVRHARELIEIVKDE